MLKFLVASALISLAACASGTDLSSDGEELGSTVLDPNTGAITPATPDESGTLLEFSGQHTTNGCGGGSDYGGWYCCGTFTHVMPARDAKGTVTTVPLSAPVVAHPEYRFCCISGHSGAFCG